MSAPSKTTKIVYWITTILLCVGMLFSSIPGLLKVQQAISFITSLGFPTYMIPFLSIAKILAVVAILVPGYPIIKEWAYAGLTFDLIGATYAQIANGTPPNQYAMMIIWFIILAFSYVFYHKKLKEIITQ